MKVARFNIVLSKAHTESVTVNYATEDGTAVAPTHYTSKTGSVTFAAGETTKAIDIAITQEPIEGAAKSFKVRLSMPVNGTLGTVVNSVVLGGTLHPYLERFRTLHTALHLQSNGYFGPQTGTNAFSIPRHIPEIDSRIINEAPDYGGESVSETVSFWLGLEAWNMYVTGEEGTPSAASFKNAWAKIEQFYVPSAANQPVATYSPASPADYVPEGELPSMYPRLADVNAVVGTDPFATELQQTYGNWRVHLWHWLIDVEGDYGFKNGDGSTKNVFINTYERGLQESSFETIAHPAWNDWNNGGGQYGFEPLYTQGKQLYPAAEFDWSQKFSYTSAPDSEVRGLQWTYHAMKFAEELGLTTQITTEVASAKKTGDYLRYALADKYFRAIGNNQSGGTGWTSLHYLINWYVAWGGGIPVAGSNSSNWSYRIGCSECHQGYQSPITAYVLSKGKDLVPQSPTAGDAWLVSAYRQLEMIRWLQSPEGPIGGGVTNSWKAQYATPTDGRDAAGKFYGMHYTYSPVWHDPPSNNWVGFQAWGQGRTADLYLEVATKTDTFSSDLAKNCEVILDRLVAWFLKEAELTTDGSFTLPSNLSWVTESQVVGETTTTPNLEGVYEYLPQNSWNGTGDFAAFWGASSVPNPTLHCTITERGTDLGVASSVAYLLIAYAQAKRLQNKFTTTIPNSTHTPEDAFTLAKELLDRIWTKYWDGKGITIPEPRKDYNRVNDTVYVPVNLVGATMPNGDPVVNGGKFKDTRTFLQTDPMWPAVEAYANGTGPVPIFTYHRFWAQSEYAISCAALYRYFQDLL